MATFDSSGVGSDVSPSYSPTLTVQNNLIKVSLGCLLYTSDAADDMQCVDLGGRRIIKKI